MTRTGNLVDREGQMYMPEQVRPGSALERAVLDAVRAREAWGLVVEGALVGARLATGDAREAALERCLACSIAVVGQRHGTVLGPVAGFVVSEGLGRAKLHELVWLDDDPLPDGALTRLAARLTASVCVRARLLRPDLELDLPLGLEGAHA